ncbi:hypothetical protein BH23PLA1_BH23PLA1_24750 [soil metagenome]
MQGVVNTLRYYAGWADKIEGRTLPVPGDFLSYTLRQPVGVGQIIPWNFPLLMLVWKWGPALACGNTLLLKPAEQTPLTALSIGQLAMDAGFPAGVINILNGLGETTGDAIVRHPDVDKIAFTGHFETAKIIQKNAADTLKRVTTELGGKSPNVVFTASPRRSGPRISTRPTPTPRRSRPAPSGSTVTTLLTSRPPSAASRCPARVEKTVRPPWNTTPNSRRSRSSSTHKNHLSPHHSGSDQFNNTIIS